MTTADTQRRQTKRRQGNRRTVKQAPVTVHQFVAPPTAPPQEPKVETTTKGQILLNHDPVDNHTVYLRMLEDWKDELVSLLPSNVSPDHFMRMALNTWAVTPRLRLCSRRTVIHALSIAAQLGLQPNGVGGEGWIVCFNSDWLPEGVLEAVFITGYQGAIKLMMQHPSVVAINAKAVCENELNGTNGHFDWQDGTDSYVDHHFNLKGDRGEPVGAYAMAWLRDAPRPVFVVMTKEEIDLRRDTSRDKDSLLWGGPFKTIGYMKTAVFQLAKIVPKSPGMALAIELENRYEQGKGTSDLSPMADPLEPTTGVSRTEQLAKQLGVGEGSD